MVTIKVGDTGPFGQIIQRVQALSTGIWLVADETDCRYLKLSQRNWAKLPLDWRRAMFPGDGWLEADEDFPLIAAFFRDAFPDVDKADIAALFEMEFPGHKLPEPSGPWPKHSERKLPEIAA